MDEWTGDMANPRRDVACIRMCTGDGMTGGAVCGDGLRIEGVRVDHALVTCAIDKDILGIGFASRVGV